MTFGASVAADASFAVFVAASLVLIGFVIRFAHHLGKRNRGGPGRP